LQLAYRLYGGKGEKMKERKKEWEAARREFAMRLNGLPGRVPGGAKYEPGNDEAIAQAGDKMNRCYNDFKEAN
jgi:hypothetical protein